MIDGKKTIKSVHRLVAETFIPNKLNKQEVNHIDGNKANNNVNNLEWVTSSENKNHACRTGLNNRSLYDAGKPKKKVVILETGETFESIHECARKLGCTHPAVVHCLNGETKTCMGYRIVYYND